MERPPRPHPQPDAGTGAPAAPGQRRRALRGRFTPRGRAERSTNIKFRLDPSQRSVPESAAAGRERGRVRLPPSPLPHTNGCQENKNQKKKEKKDKKGGEPHSREEPSSRAPQAARARGWRQHSDYTMRHGQGAEMGCARGGGAHGLPLPERSPASSSSAELGN